MVNEIKSAASVKAGHFQEAIDHLGLNKEAGTVTEVFNDYLCSSGRVLNNQESEVIFKQLALHYTELSIGDTESILQEVKKKKNHKSNNNK